MFIDTESFGKSSKMMMQIKKGEIYMEKIKDRKKEEVMKRVFQLMLQLNENQLTMTEGVMTGMMLEHKLKEQDKVS